MEYYTNLTGDGTTKTFYFTFPFFGVNDIHVTVNDVEQTTDDYTLTATQTPNDADTEYTGGCIEFLTAPANGAEIVIYREIDLTRHIDYQPTEQPQSYQLNQEFNQCIGALRELKIKLINAIGLANIPTVANLLEQITRITETMPDCLTTDDLDEINDAIADLESAITTLNGYDYVVESQLPTANNNYTWYRKYKSGWVEQGGLTESSAGATRKNITFPVPMADANYTAFITLIANLPYGSDGTNFGVDDDKTATSMGIYTGNTAAAAWCVQGMAATN
ncbi:MAG: hypothetical protein IJQ90_00050 [Alphaproteobacteria bacterium]|nr:hypothetical protein [Alphaproteobacteria bacterium]